VREYITPETEIVRFNVEDVIVTSAGNGEWSEEDEMS